jgi:pimeloyl-ACP methyl ester carboxylesterase
MGEGAMRLLFCHGFEGHPEGGKPRALRAWGHQVTAPLMYGRGWRFEDQVQTVLDAVDADPTMQVVVGSSLGGFAAAVAASRRSDRELRLLLLAPAVGLHQVWADRLGPEGLARWQATDALPYPHAGAGPVTLPWALHAECRAHAEVVVTHPLVIVHGLADAVIPVNRSVELAARSPGLRRLYAVPDGHRLMASLATVREALAHLTAP